MTCRLTMAMYWKRQISITTVDNEKSIIYKVIFWLWRRE